MEQNITFGPTNHGYQFGQNNGSIHISQERPETPPDPSCFVPFRRDPHFVAREALLNNIRAKCETPASRTALVGVGGIGKSQIAIEYAWQLHERSPRTWVFWIHASNFARFEQDFRAVADQLKIRGRRDPQNNILSLVSMWLADKRKGSWLLILDNVDDAEFLCQRESAKPRNRLLDYLPQVPHGSVLITSRRRGAAARLVEWTDIILLQPMTKIQAIGLLKKKLNFSSDQDEALAQLAKTLDYMPLALVQAAAYISKRRSHLSISQYLQEFDESDQQKATLFDIEGSQLRQDFDHNESILRTCWISYEHIRKTRTSATDLLSLMSFFDRQGIPVSLLQRNRNPSSDDLDQKREAGHLDWRKDKSFEDDVLMLQDYALIGGNSDSVTLEMHRLIQVATRHWLEANGAAEYWKGVYITRLSEAFPDGRYENWTRCQKLYPHVKLALDQQPTTSQDLEKWASLLFNAAWYSFERGSIAEAERMSQISFKTRVSILGREHPATLLSQANLAVTYCCQGRWKAAEELGVQVMETSKRVLGEEHPETLRSQAILAVTYQNQGRWKAAEELGVQVVETSKRVLGEEHPDTLRSQVILEVTYWNQGRWKAAEELGVQVMETSKRVLGEEHPETLRSQAILAVTYQNQGRWKAAEELGVQVMETRKRVLGDEHPETLRSQANLAWTLKSQNRLSEAVKLMSECSTLRSKTLGDDHPDAQSSIQTMQRWKKELTKGDRKWTRKLFGRC